jgi:hypothetical protein
MRLPLDNSLIANYDSQITQNRSLTPSGPPVIGILQNPRTTVKYPTPFPNESLCNLPILRMMGVTPNHQHIINCIWVPEAQYIKTEFILIVAVLCPDKVIADLGMGEEI